MANIFTFKNGVKIDSVGSNTVISSESIKIVLDEYGNLVSLENKSRGGAAVTLKEDAKQEDLTSGALANNYLRKKITELLRNIGIPANLKGYSYIRTAILLAYEDESYLDAIVKGLYPKIARLHGTTGNRVERAIRHAVEIAYTRGDTYLLDEIFSNSIDAEKGKATNSEFLSTLVDKLKLETL